MNKNGAYYGRYRLFIKKFKSKEPAENT